MGGRSQAEYLTDEGLKLIIERLLEIVGEALNKADGIDPGLKVQIPDLRVAVNVRHRIIHGYDTIDHVILWEAVTTSLPSLILQIDSVLGRGDE